MPRQARRESNSGIYHVTARGAGRRRLFEDDKDRLRFVERLHTLPEKDGVRLLAWCLMDNHAHLLAQASVASLSYGLHRLATSYAHYFNGRHGHVGPVFQAAVSTAPPSKRKPTFSPRSATSISIRWTRGPRIHATAPGAATANTSESRESATHRWCWSWLGAQNPSRDTATRPKATTTW